MLSSKSFIACLLALPEMGMAMYQLQDDYTSNFFDMFDFFSEPDPTHGFVQYVDRDTAFSSGLVNDNNGKIYIGADTTNNAPDGRPSVRLQSKTSYDEGLIILDLKHMPGSICGTWPAFWTAGPSWPDHGEVDIIEGVNTQTTNGMTLHTNAGCEIGSMSGFTGSVEESNCDVVATDNQGCSISTDAEGAYGSALNDAGGAVYATEITADHISVWHFAPGEVPSDITAGTPDPSTWPLPSARFAGGCDIPSKINQQNIIFDLTFCGDWAGETFAQDGCGNYGSCEDYVANNPGDFAEAYWEVNDLKVYTGGPGGGNGTAPNGTAASLAARSHIASHQYRSRHASHLLHHLGSK